MGDKSGIEWTDATWNAVTGCNHVSAGCDHCYAETLALRLQRMGQQKYANGFRVTLHEKALAIPLRWREPRRIFVNSMSDQWHVDVPEQFTDRMFAVMAVCSQHTFQILTKRPQRAANYLNHPDRQDLIRSAAFDIIKAAGRNYQQCRFTWPLPNVWIGTSVEDERVVHRIDALRKCLAVVRFLSCEPLIGPLPNLDLSGIQWVITGGESGEGARHCHPDWVRSIRDQCHANKVAFFHKQWGGRTPKSGGRLLDHRTHDEFPVAVDRMLEFA